jgi:hypothetical protein
MCKGQHAQRAENGRKEKRRKRREGKGCPAGQWGFPDTNPLLIPISLIHLSPRGHAGKAAVHTVGLSHDNHEQEARGMIASYVPYWFTNRRRARKRH